MNDEYGWALKRTFFLESAHVINLFRECLTPNK